MQCGGHHAQFPVRRSPHGERGLKSACRSGVMVVMSRSPHGERGLKYDFGDARAVVAGRSPHGERGLKSYS